MANYTYRFNPISGEFDIVQDLSLIHIKDPVDTYNDLPITENTENDARFVKDTDILYVWSIASTSGSLSDWKETAKMSIADLDALDDGSIYGRVKNTELEEGQIKRLDDGTNEVSALDAKDAVDKKHIQNSDEYLNTQIAHTIYVDKNRTDSYTPTGSITQPYKVIQNAINAITTATLYNRFLVLIHPGEYEEQIVMKRYVNLAGLSIDTVWIKSTAGDVVTTDADADISNMLINYEGSDSSKVALRLNSGAITITDQVSVYSLYTAIQINNGAFLITYDTGTLAGEADGVIVKSGGYGSFSGFTFSGWGSPYYDLTVESGGFADIYPDCYFYNERINNLGTISLTHSSSRTKNDSSITGDTVKDALDTIKTDAIDKAHDKLHEINNTLNHLGISGSGIEDNFMAIDVNGLPKNSGKSAIDFANASHNHLEEDITDLDHYTSEDFSSDFDLADLANLGTKSYNDLTDKPDLSDLHFHSNKVELDLVTDGNHDVRIDNPHIVTVDQLDLASGTVASDIDDAITKKHTQNTDTGTSNNFDVTGEISIKLYSQNDEPTLGQDNRMAIWIDTDDSNRVYLLYRRGTGDQVAVELA